MGVRNKSGDVFPFNPALLRCCGGSLGHTVHHGAARLLGACGWSRQSQAPPVPSDHQPESATVAE
eukprot:3486201-Rhodomonas_salina.1